MPQSENRIEFAKVRVVLDHPLARVWARIGQFGGFELWVDGVAACEVEGEGIGAVRTVTLNGRVVRERLELFEPEHHQIGYAILEPHSLPAEGVHGAIALTALGPASTELIWRSDAAVLHVPPCLLGERIEAFYRASILGLERLLGASPLSPEAEASIDAERRAGDQA